MSDKIHAYAAINKGDKLKPFEYAPGALGADQVEIAVEYCGVCHSDLSMLDNDWGMTEYPLVPGHEVVGKIKAIGEHVTDRKVGQRVGLGWFSGCCMACRNCLSGGHNLCSDSLPRLRRPRAGALGVDPTSSRCSRLQKGRPTFLRRDHGLQSHRPE